nr:hypothetical protein [Tanacetum cinerariifolium]
MSSRAKRKTSPMHTDDSRSSLSRLRPDAVSKFQTPSLNRSRRCRFMLAMPSPRSASKDFGLIILSNIASIMGLWPTKPESTHGKPLSVSYDASNEVNVNASQAKRAAKIHDLLALVANINASSSSYRSPPTYYVTHTPSVIRYNDDYQGDAIGDDQEDSLTTTMMNTGNQGDVVRNVNVERNTGNAINVQRILRTMTNSGNGTNVQCITAMPKVTMLKSVLSPKFVIQRISRNRCCLLRKMRLGLLSMMNIMIFYLESASRQ